MLKDNLNPLIFAAGFVMLFVGLWHLGTHIAWIGGGAVLMVVVVADAMLQMVTKK